MYCVYRLHIQILGLSIVCMDLKCLLVTVALVAEIQAHCVTAPLHTVVICAFYMLFAATRWTYELVMFLCQIVAAPVTVRDGC
jgi:hypothetical protein